MTPTSSSTAPASSIVSALGGGSGIDMAALAANLVEAQFAPRSARLTARSERLDRQISSAAALKGQLLQLATSLGERVRAGDLSPQPKVANAAIASAAITPGGRPSGTYRLEVLALAQPQSLASPAFSDAAAPVGSGTLTLRFGTAGAGGFTPDPAGRATTITIPAGATLADAASAINAAGSGVTAYVASTPTGAKLVLKGQEGAANGFVVETTPDIGGEALSALGWTPADPATDRLLAPSGDARFKLDGLDLASPTNTTGEIAPGLSLTLTGTNPGAPTLISFASIDGAVSGAMQDLVGALNTIAAALREATDPKSGDLATDPGARELRRQFAALAGSNLMPGAAEGTPRSLADLGMATERDGSFRLDTARLAKAIKDDPAAVAAMFTTGIVGIYAAFDRLSRNTSVAGNPGTLGGSLARFTAQKTQTAAELTKLADQQERLRATMVARFAAVDSRVSASRSTLSFLQNQIDAWNAKS